MAKVTVKKLSRYDIRRRQRRNTHWEDARDLIYNRNDEKGFITFPRTLSMICTLIKTRGEKNDPSRVYFELWSRQRDDGYIEIDDIDELAQASGFYRGSQTRRTRSCREALDRLATLGFIRVKGKGQRKHAFVLILHPHDVVQQMRHADPKAIPDWWWQLFELRIQDIGAQLRWKAPEPENPLDGEDDDLPF